jgi:opacity protein-like surface antigen
MRKHLAFALAGLMVAATAATSVAAEYDRYDRGPGGGSPGYYYAPPPPPPPRRAVGFHAGPYLFGNIGVFEPNNYSNNYNDNYNGAYDLSGYSSGPSGNLGFGARLNPFAAVEGTVGYFSAERGSSSNKASVVPVTLGGRLILPNPMFEPYLGGGIGVYFARLKEDSISFTPTQVYPGTDDSETALGGYLSLGMDLWLNPRTALNFEGRYQMVQPTFTDKRGGTFDLDMSGWEFNVGIRVNF